MEYAYLKVESKVPAPPGKPPLPAKPINLSSIPLTIGRHETNRLVISDTLASRFHCVIEQSKDGYALRDLQSRNGTLLNGQRVMTAQLKSNDVISIGAIFMTIVIRHSSQGTEVAPSAPPANTSPAAQDDVLDDLEVIEEGDVPVQGESIFATLRRTAAHLLDKNFEPDAIDLINTRGKLLRDERPGADKSTVSETDKLLRLILLICFRSHATDIHLEPRAEDFLLRLRMDGNLLDIATLNREQGTRLAAMIKILCELDTTQRAIVQEGHFAARAPLPPKKIAPPKPGAAIPNPPPPPIAAPPQTDHQRRVDYRVSFVPSLHGQKMVVRIFDTANAPALLDDLHLPRHIADEVREELTKDAGLILVCGPTGSGKTTTLYSLLRSCGSSFRNIVTIEDPVEVQIEGTTQLPVDEANSNTFPALLRSVLRQDPDVIMVGEIRDPETARIALQASMTGHLVLSTIHTRDTIGTVFRLLDLGIEPYMVAQGMHLVIAQRLVRKLCMNCRRPFPPTPEDRRRMGSFGATIEKIYAPVGCPKCLGTGFYSRLAFFEFLSTSEKIREQILRNPSITEFQTLLGPDFRRLADQGYQLVAEGLTSIDEVERAVGK